MLITLLDDKSQEETLQAAESALKEDWLSEEEDEAWQHLQNGA